MLTFSDLSVKTLFVDVSLTCQTISLKKWHTRQKVEKARANEYLEESQNQN
jgi:hypothetical protein